MAEKNVKDGWSMLIKFGSKDNLEKLQAGQLYMKNLQYYVDLEKNTDDEDIGDKYDGHLILKDAKITVYSYDTGELVTQFDAPTASMNLGYLKCPVFCMFMFDYRNHTEENLRGDTLTVQYQFTEKQLSKMSKFGSHALIIKNGEEFMKRVKNGLQNNGYGYTRDLVQYYDGNTFEHMKEISENDMRIAFWKRQKYAYQQEYRILAHAQTEDYLSIEIGDLRDITELVQAKDLLNTLFRVNYKVGENV